MVLSSDTAHHRYFINSLINNGVQLTRCLFESRHVSPPFPTGPLFEEFEDKFEEVNFFTDVDSILPEGLVHDVSTINSDQAIELIKSIDPDFGLVFGTGKIKRDVIELFHDGLVNVHRGVAQKYRGLDSDLWAIYHGDYKNVGVTIHKVEAALDTGGIVYQEKMPILPGMQIHQIRYYTSVIATELMCKTVYDYLENRIIFIPQDKKGRYYSIMPLELKKIVQSKFNRYCEKLNEYFVN